MSVANADDVDALTWLIDGNAADFDARTSLNGVGNDDNFCARIFTGRFHTASIQSINHDTFI